MSKVRALVGVKRVLDYALKPRIDKAGKGFDLAGQKMSVCWEIEWTWSMLTLDVSNQMNPFCEIAMEEAVQMRERDKDRVEDILAVSCGPKKSGDILRNALAMGADRSILVQTAEDATLEPLAVAKIMKQVAEQEKSNLIVLGKQSIDDDCHQTGQMLAGLLNWPQATCASKIEFKGDKVLVDREIDGGIETVEADLPIVITTDLRLNKPRYLALAAIMKAKKKKMDTKPIADFAVDTTPRLETISVKEPPARKGGEKVESVSELLSKMKSLGAI